MLWMLTGLGVCLVALFRVLHFVGAKQMKEDMALILAEYPTMQQSATPSKSQTSINATDRAKIKPAIINQCLEKGPA